jgi:ABC-type transport system involved in multi-copper enzyme maturation permease subunit
MIPHGAFSVLKFELKRSLTPGRIAAWLLLVSFPIFVVSVIKYYEPPETTEQVWGVLLFGLIPEVICLFGLLLWATPVVQAELEGRTWIYLAVRPRGRVSVLLGKFLTAVVWTATAGWLSATVCTFVANPLDLSEAWEALLTLEPSGKEWQAAFSSLGRMWLTMMALVGLSACAYGALYCLLGALFHRRAMVVAVAYTLVFEFLVSLIPAVINKLTVQYRLRNLLFTWMDWKEDLPDGASLLLGDEPFWVHLAVLAGLTIALLLIATQIIQKMEYVSAEES